MSKSFLLSILTICCAAIIESAILSNIYILPVVPDLVLICSIYLSLLNGKIFGELAGFASGLTMDFITGVPFGFNCIFRTILGYIAGIFSEHIIITGILIPALTVAVGTVTKHLLIWIISFFYVYTINPTNIFSVNFLFELLANTILAPFIFKFLGYFYKSLAINANKEKFENA